MTQTYTNAFQDCCDPKKPMTTSDRAAGIIQGIKDMREAGTTIDVSKLSDMIAPVINAETCRNHNYDNDIMVQAQLPANKVA